MHIPLYSISDDKIRPPLLFNPPLKKTSDPHLFSQPPTYKKISIPTSILRIRSLATISSNVKTSLYIITNKLLNYDKCSSKTAQNKLNLYKNSFCFRGASPPKPPPRALPLDLAGGAAPKPPIIASRYRARHWRMTTTYFTTTPLLVGTPSP